MKIYPITNLTGISDFYVGINQIEIDPNEVQISKLVDLIESIQSQLDGVIVQFFNDRYILNQEHILHACFYAQKAFYTKNNISKKKNLELLLYLATKRQIKLGLESFGVNNYNLKSGRISLCVISLVDNIQQVNIKINNYLHSKDIELNLGNLSLKKYKTVKEHFEFSDNQILTVLKSYGHKNDTLDLNFFNLESLYEALNDLICEKMALLSLEKRRTF